MQVLSGILTKATGQSVLDFARENLFEPLGIQAPHNRRIQNKEEYLAFLKDKHVSGWVVDPRGVNTAGWGLALSARDMGKIGQIYLNKGRFQGRQIVSSQWIEESTRAHSHWGDRAYGYLWWIIEDQEFSGTAALGDGGNVIYVSPEKKMVIAIASRFMPRPKDRMELIRKHIAPLF
jgi:CubicO group peptidase (beta-lactamase class C family)